jgi:hypothetical protein
VTICRHSAAGSAILPQETCLPARKPCSSLVSELRRRLRAPSRISDRRDCSNSGSRANATGRIRVARLHRAYPQGRVHRVSTRQEENSVLIQLGAARRRGGIEPLIFGRDARGNYDTAGPKLPLRILVQTDSAILENLAALVAKGDRQQEFGASVDPLYLFSCGVMWHKQRDASAGWELIQFLRSQDKTSAGLSFLSDRICARFWFSCARTGSPARDRILALSSCI